jgi:hypothetical protein
MVLKCEADWQRASDAGRASGLGFDALARANPGPHGALNLKVVPARRFPPPWSIAIIRQVLVGDAPRAFHRRCLGAVIPQLFRTGLIEALDY